MDIKLTTLDIDLESKWNDYPSDILYLWSENEKTIFIIFEGDGENLFSKDIAEGYKDYWMTDYITSDGYCDGGQWMETELIGDLDYTIQGVLDRMMECDLWEDDWEILDNESGEQLWNQFYEQIERGIKYE